MNKLAGCSLVITLGLTTLLSTAFAAETTMDVLDRIQMELKLSDITKHKNEDAIIYLYKHNVIGGYPDGTFRPDGTINRAELLKILVGDKVASLDVIDEGGKPRPEYMNCFPDVRDEWFAASVCYAKKQGWVGGYPDGAFRPAQAVTKAEAVKMLVNIQGFPLSGQQSPFDDVKEGDWYAPFIQTAYEKGLLELPRKGFNGFFYGAGEAMTRGSVAESMFRVAIMKGREADVYVASDDFPERVQVTTGNLFPINLVSNHVWTIEIWNKYKGYYKVQRDDDHIAIQGQNEYVASFIEKDGQQFLMLQECHYYYKYIREDLMCDTVLIPANITQESVHGFSEQFTDKDGLEYTVKILSKAEKEVVDCKIRAVTNHGEKIYYTKDDAVQGIPIFRCFVTEQDAINTGYTKSSK